MDEEAVEAAENMARAWERSRRVARFSLVGAAAMNFLGAAGVALLWSPTESFRETVFAWFLIGAGSALLALLLPYWRRPRRLRPGGPGPRPPGVDYIKP